MIEELQLRLTHFLGEASRTRCFCHVINLVVKSIVTQFDIPVKDPKSRSATDELDKHSELEDDNEDLQELERLSRTIEAEEEAERIQDEQEENEKDNDEGWVDEQMEMSRREVRNLQRSVLPARHVLTKVGPC